MNDWWNDPTEEEELPTCPECTDGYGEVSREGSEGLVLICDECGHRWSIPAKLDYAEDLAFDAELAKRFSDD